MGQPRGNGVVKQKEKWVGPKVNQDTKIGRGGGQIKGVWIS